MANEVDTPMDPMPAIGVHSLLRCPFAYPQIHELPQRNNPVLPSRQLSDRPLHLPTGRKPVYFRGNRPVGGAGLRFGQQAANDLGEFVRLLFHLGPGTVGNAPTSQ